MLMDVLFPTLLLLFQHLYYHYQPTLLRQIIFVLEIVMALPPQFHLGVRLRINILGVTDKQLQQLQIYAWVIIIIPLQTQMAAL